MEVRNPIQVIYAPGTFGNCVRWMLDRFTKGSNFKDIDSPWDKNDRAHGFEDEDFSRQFIRGHQVIGRGDSPDPTADKIVINFDSKDLLFAERCGFYRNPGQENEKSRHEAIIRSADASFVKDTFGDTSCNKSVAKELIKIQFHDIKNHKWWNSMNEFLSDKSHHHFDMYSMWDQDQLKDELARIAERFRLEFDINDIVIKNVVNKISNSYPVKTRSRANQILDAISSKDKKVCDDLDIMEQAYIEAELEKIHDCVIFPYGANWFNDTAQVSEFLDTYPSYLKHMNPRLPWYNNIKNPFHLTGKIDK